MSHVPENLRYTKEHEWLLLHEDGSATVGITEYAQESLGDITFVELPAVDESFVAGDACGVVESVKAASDLYLPLDCTVLEVNEQIDAEPELLNSDPYGSGWLLKVKIGDASQTEALLDAAAYSEII